MSKNRSDWHIPQEVRGFLSSIFFMPLAATIAILASMLLPPLTALHRVDVARLFAAGLAAGVCGIALLFFAKLPVYRQRRFFTFGPRELDRFHRRLYWLAYLFVLSSVGLLVMVWFRVS